MAGLSPHAGENGLIARVCAAVGKPVVVAGSIDRPERIQAVVRGRAAGFTIGTAALDGAFPAGGLGLSAQLAAIRSALAEVGATNTSVR